LSIPSRALPEKVEALKAGIRGRRAHQLRVLVFVEVLRRFMRVLLAKNGMVIFALITSSISIGFKPCFWNTDL
jgi:hypothetical protein